MTGCFKTRLALLWMNLSNEPLVAIYHLIPFILRKELCATTYQIALFTTLSPVLSVFSFYWGSWVTHRKDMLLTNLISAWVLSRIPFLFLPFVNDFWSILVCCSVYQLFNRASTPALMEILKQNIPKKPREHIFSFYYVITVIEGILIGLALVNILHVDNTNWKTVFLICALLSLTSVWVQLKIQVSKEKNARLNPPQRAFVEPLKGCFQLLRDRKDFARFQWGFMLGGFGLMIMAPARYIFSADTGAVSISNMTIARCVFVGIGLAGSALIWKKALQQFSVHKLTTWILVGFGIYPLLFTLAPLHIFWFYLAHLVYGIAQAGSHLVWHLSGTIFAGENGVSTPFTTTNVLMIGLRGLVGPFLGGVLCDYFGAGPVLLLGALICWAGAWYMAKSKAPVAVYSK